jgi:rfaE bifunctional protein nucleotidyltransferase chain/domain
MRTATLEELHIMREKWQRDGLQLVFTNGVFDLLHSGHVVYLEQARALGDVLVVGLNSDASTQAIKGPSRPLVPVAERALVLTALRCVDYVTIFEQTTAEQLVATLKPDVYVKGGDYAVPVVTSDAGEPAVDYERLPEARIVRDYGGEVVLLPYQSGRSTTALIEKIVRVYRGGGQ